MNKKFLLLSLLFLLLAGAIFYVVSGFIQPAPKKEIIIASGSKEGQYYQNALKYKRLLASEGVSAKIINTSGSVENIELLKSKKVDVAFIQNGTLEVDSLTELEGIGSIYYEPLWLFYKKELKDINYIQDFKGKRLAIGAPASGTRDLAQEVLRINEIDSLNTSLLSYGTKKAKESLLNNEVDAIFLVISAASPIAKELLEDENIALFSFKRANAYSKKIAYLEPVDLYEGIIDLSKNMPIKDKKLVATTASLVTHQGVPDELIRIFAKKVKKTHSRKSVFNNQGYFPHTADIDLPLSQEADKYFRNGDTFLEKIFPFWVASNLDRFKILLIPLLTLLIPLVKGVLPLYKWSIRSKVYKWYEQIQEVDASIHNLDKTALKEQLVRLENLDTEIKAETKVPLSYMGEYYNLIMHLDLVISRVKARVTAG